MNASDIYLKEKSHILKSLISTQNINGTIVKNYKDYEIRCYFTENRLKTYDNNSRMTSYIMQERNDTSAKKIDIISDYVQTVGLIRNPVKLRDLSNNSIIDNYKIKNGDCIVNKYNNNKIYEIYDYSLEIENLKSYYNTSLIDLYIPPVFSEYMEEIYIIFFKVFKELETEAVRFSPFMNNEYFKSIIDKPFLTYIVEERYTAKTHIKKSYYNSVKDRNIKNVVTHRYMDIIINLYDVGNYINIDTVMNDNRLFTYILKKINTQFNYIRDLQVLNCKYLGETTIMLNQKTLNQKKFIVKISLDTFYEIDNDYIDSAKIYRR